MTNSILSLGLSGEIVTSLTDCLAATIHQANSVAEAHELLEELYFSSVILSTRPLERPTRDVQGLIGLTPLTTLIVLLCENDDTDLDAGELTDMGVKWIMTPFHVDDLVRKLRH